MFPANLLVLSRNLSAFLQHGPMATTRTVLAAATFNRCAPSATGAVAGRGGALLASRAVSVQLVSPLSRAAPTGATQRRHLVTTRYTPNAGETGLAGRRPSDGPRAFFIHTSEGLPPPGPAVILDALPSAPAASAGGGDEGDGPRVSDPAVQAEAAAHAVEEAERRAAEFMTDQESPTAAAAAAATVRGGAGQLGGGGQSGAERRDVQGGEQGLSVGPGTGCRINILVDIPVDE
jgi:hypothetical protein